MSCPSVPSFDFDSRCGMRRVCCWAPRRQDIDRQLRASAFSSNDIANASSVVLTAQICSHDFLCYINLCVRIYIYMYVCWRGWKVNKNLYFDFLCEWSWSKVRFHLSEPINNSCWTIDIPMQCRPTRVRCMREVSCKCLHNGVVTNMAAMTKFEAKMLKIN